MLRGAALAEVTPKVSNATPVLDLSGETALANVVLTHAVAGTVQAHA